MRTINAWFIVLFMAMLTLPLVFVDLSQDRVSVQENRMLAAHPDLADIKNHPGTFIRGFDAWFKDSTGFREQLLALYNVMGKNQGLNHFWYTDGQYIFLVGEQGHHFFAWNGFMISTFQGKQFLSDGLLAGMADKLEEVKAYLDGKGIPFVVMICTSKESIYPEFYPKAVKRGPEPTQLDLITGYLQEHTNADVFNIKQALLAKKDDYLLYSVSLNDLGHYTEIGAFFAYRELMKHINIYFPGIVPYELNDVEISYSKEGRPYVFMKTEKNYKKLETSFFDDVKLNRPFTWENTAYENTDRDLPVILFIRDSYADENFIGKYFARHFGKAIFIHYQNMEHFEEFITRYKPDIVVFEAVEHQLDVFANHVIRIPELITAYGGSNGIP